jgi:hypothetical protein
MIFMQLCYCQNRKLLIKKLSKWQTFATLMSATALPLLSLHADKQQALR